MRGCLQVNYGKPFKMNTVEAMAATLYIAGLKDDAIALLEPFAFGQEFIKINLDALNAYASCASAEEVSSECANACCGDSITSC
jgi:pre-rRNA-processing protein TSR3